MKCWKKKCFPYYDQIFDLVEGQVETGATAFFPGDSATAEPDSDDVDVDQGNDDDEEDADGDGNDQVCFIVFVFFVLFLIVF